LFSIIAASLAEEKGDEHRWDIIHLSSEPSIKMDTITKIITI
jgi:hypothetical protein